jgi:nitric oxide dioxygenase
MITFVVHKLNNLNDVVKDVKALGERHKNYKVLPEYYNTVGAALLWTLEQALGPKWNDEVREAWTKAYTILSSTMIEAAAAKSKVA